LDFVNSRTQNFRNKALDCLHAAQRAIDPVAKVSLLELAQQWHQLAEQAENLDRERPKT
jgi:chemotaxis regulatin CheY-phosphate phosphatase CheZ